MSNCAAFHTQLASIMEVLANAAVAEICKLVDDGYAVLRLEMSQSQKENKVLKRKLQTMEMRLARECTQRIESRQRSVKNRSGGAMVCDILRAPAREEDPFSNGDGVFGNQSDIGQDSAVLSVVRRDEPTDMENDVPGSPLIKEELPEDDLRKSALQGGRKITMERVVDLGAEGDGTAIVDQTSSSKGTEELTELHRTRHSIWEVSGLEAVFKAEPEKESVNHRPQRTGSEHRAERLNILGSERSVCQRPSQQRTFFSQGDGAGGADGPTCSNAAETTDSEDMSVQSVLQPSKEEGSGSSLSSLGSPEWKPEVVIIKEEAELRLWEKETVSGALHVQPRHYLDGRMRKEVHLEHFNMCPPKAQTVASKPTAKDSSESSPFDSFSASNSDKTQSKVGSRDKRFFCTFCGKGFSCPKKVEIHQRVHTGEKPFSCTQCRKRFAQSGNLKRHQRVHTGEKPFSCTQCEKRFSHLHQLKMHQRVHTGERPYSCTQCGKRFSERSYLRIHQQKNHIAVYNLN